MSATRRVRMLVLLVLLALAAGGWPPARAWEAQGYAASDDTLRVRPAAEPAAGARRGAVLGAVVQGYLSPRGLPPVAGFVVVTDTGLVFRSFDGGYGETLLVVGPVRESAGGRWRAAAVSLAYVDPALGRATYLFRVDGGVFETDAPGPLLDLAQHPAWLDSLASREWRADRPLAADQDIAAVDALLRGVSQGTYADTLYSLFGRPSRPAGLVGARGRAAGRLGEYVATRDSLALDPARMSSIAQLRHTLAHELAHRWQAQAPATVAMLWRGVPPIRDPRRYGYGHVGEQQAEAAAFAVHFLLTSATATDPERELDALDHYELLVPGTRTLARYFALQPAFRGHPLRRLLTVGVPHQTS